MAITAALRAAMTREFERVCTIYQYEISVRHLQGNHRERFRRLRLQETRELLDSRPAFDEAAIMAEADIIKVVSAYSGPSRGYDSFNNFLSYERYRDNARKYMTQAKVRVATGRSTLLVLLSERPIEWDLQVAPGSSLAGVMVRSTVTPSVKGLARDVPLSIETKRTASARSPSTKRMIERTFEGRYWGHDVEFDWHHYIDEVTLY